MGESIELCGGTHCQTTGQIGLYITVQETSVAAGIRRIEALTGRGAENYLRQRSATVERVSGKLQAQPDQLESRVDQVLQELATARRQIAQFQREKAQQQTVSLATQAREVAGVPVVAASVDVPDDKVIREMGDMVLNKIGRPGVVVLAGLLDERVSLQVSVSTELTRRGLHAGKIAGAVGQKLGGKGGGRPESAQGGGKDKAQLGAALDLVAKFVKENVQ
jgi:alanyl-tRNA synthetase